MVTIYLLKVAEKMIIKGLSMDDIAEITELTVEKLIEFSHENRISLNTEEIRR